MDWAVAKASDARTCRTGSAALTEGFACPFLSTGSDPSAGGAGNRGRAVAGGAQVRGVSAGALVDDANFSAFPARTLGLLVAPAADGAVFRDGLSSGLGSAADTCVFGALMASLAADTAVGHTPACATYASALSTFRGHVFAVAGAAEGPVRSHGVDPHLPPATRAGLRRPNSVGTARTATSGCNAVCEVRRGLSAAGARRQSDRPVPGCHQGMGETHEGRWRSRARIHQSVCVLLEVAGQADAGTGRDLRVLKRLQCLGAGHSHEL